MQPAGSVSSRPIYTNADLLFCGGFFSSFFCGGFLASSFLCAFFGTFFGSFLSGSFLFRSFCRLVDRGLGLGHGLSATGEEK